jgi:hypothetical protein
MKTRMRRARLPETVEFLRRLAARESQYIGRLGWRPSKKDIALLKRSRRDAIAYRALARGWRRAGFRIAAIRRLAGRDQQPTHATSKEI